MTDISAIGPKELKPVQQYAANIAIYTLQGHTLGAISTCPEKVLYTRYYQQSLTLAKALGLSSSLLLMLDPSMKLRYSRIVQEGPARKE